MTNKVIELNGTILTLRSENAQLLEKILLSETESLPNNDSNEQQNICYQVPVSNSFSTLRNIDNHEDTSVLTENSSSEGLQLVEWAKVTKKKSKEKGKPTTQTYLIPTLLPTLLPTKSTQEVHQSKPKLHP